MQCRLDCTLLDGFQVHLLPSLSRPQISMHVCMHVQALPFTVASQRRLVTWRCWRQRSTGTAATPAWGVRVVRAAALGVALRVAALRAAPRAVMAVVMAARPRCAS